MPHRTGTLRCRVTAWPTSDVRTTRERLTSAARKAHAWGRRVGPRVRGARVSHRAEPTWGPSSGCLRARRRVARVHGLRAGPERKARTRSSNAEPERGTRTPNSNAGPERGAANAKVLRGSRRRRPLRAPPHSAPPPPRGCLSARSPLARRCLRVPHRRLPCRPPTPVSYRRLTAAQAASCAAPCRTASPPCPSPPRARTCRSCTRRRPGRDTSARSPGAARGGTPCLSPARSR